MTKNATRRTLPNSVGQYKSYHMHSLKIGLLFEWCKCGTLVSFIKDANDKPYALIGFPIAQNLALDMLRGNSYLYDNDIIHRDVKPENVLVSNINCNIILPAA